MSKNKDNDFEDDEEMNSSSSENVAAPEDNGESLRAFFDENFLQYASYVVRDRAVPDVDDGLKPVQRRILHVMHETDNGQFHKVAGVVGDTMHYHPHGDASIYGALVVLANKNLYIERQGNFGNILLGTSAAAPRYIECRLTELARETLYNPEITEYTEAYDGRSMEPVRLPAKLPSLLIMGSDGIAVGMATSVFPHNFRELLEAEIAILEKREFHILPDFPQGALMDAGEYEDGMGKIRCRARIEPDGDKRIIIREIPPSTTTESVIASIENAAKKGKIKIGNIHDYSAKDICIEITLQRGIYAEETIKELYAYTNCEVSLSSNILVIQDKVPVVLTVSQVLQRNVKKLQEYLKKELELLIHKLMEQILGKTLAQIFIENKIYKKLESCHTMEAIYEETRQGLEKHREEFYRDITDEDISTLLQIPIRRISAFDIEKNQQELQSLEDQKKEAERKLAHLVRFAISYLKGILEEYGADYPRRTEITSFEAIDVKKVARRDVKVYHDKQNNFLGTSVHASSKEAQPLVLTEFDKIMLLRGDGTCKVIGIPDKEYIGPTKYVFAMNKEQIYRILYRDKVDGSWYVKRFKVGQFILEKEYHVIPENCLIEQLYTNSGVVVSMELTSQHRRSVKTVEVDFDSYPLRSRESRGFKITSFAITNYRVVNRGSSVEAAPDASAAEAAPPGSAPAAPPAVSGGEAPAGKDEMPEEDSTGQGLLFPLDDAP